MGGKPDRPATPGDIELGYQGPSRKSAVSVGDALDIDSLKVRGEF